MANIPTGPAPFSAGFLMLDTTPRTRGSGRSALHRGLAQLTARQPTRGREATRILCLMVLGIFAITAPMATLSTAIVVLGAPMLAMAGGQLVVLPAPPTHPSQAPVPARRDVAERFGHQTGQADQRGMHPVLKGSVVEPAAAARSH